MAPEIMKGGTINKKCDIYSYGMLLFEIVTLELPFKDATDQMVIFYVLSKEQPSLPQSDSKCPPFLRHLIFTCWVEDPSDRPSFQEIILALSSEKLPLSQ